MWASKLDAETEMTNRIFLKLGHWGLVLPTALDIIRHALAGSPSVDDVGRNRLLLDKFGVPGAFFSECAVSFNDLERRAQLC